MAEEKSQQPKKQRRNRINEELCHSIGFSTLSNKRKEEKLNESSSCKKEEEEEEEQQAAMLQKNWY